VTVDNGAASSHRDCRNFAPLDVVKGLCHRTKGRVLADDPACVDRSPLPRCAHCARFEPDAASALGVCAAAPTRPMAYPDMVAVTCGQFAWRGAAADQGLRR
jgi:4-hydroxyphenylacetate decarboxylase small subunit